MKIAALITVEPPPEKPDHEIALQTELLTRLGSQLHSVRLVEPRLFDRACRAAAAEAPDLFLVFCDAHLARHAGQFAHDKKIPLALVCEPAHPVWTSRLCSSTTKDEILDALAGGGAASACIDAGAVGGTLFFDRAVAGAVGHMADMRAAHMSHFLPAQLRLALLVGIVGRPTVRVQSTGFDVARACAVQVTVNGNGTGGGRENASAGVGGLDCRVYAPARRLARTLAPWAAFRDRGWADRRETIRFDAARLIVDGGRSIWLSLDGEPMRFAGAARVGIVPRAVEVVAPSPDRAGKRQATLAARPRVTAELF